MGSKFPPWNPAPITLAKLNIDEASVSVAGCSHAGDFAHQFHVAFSKTVKNACVFSGQPYHCAVQAFQGEDQVVATPESSVPYCEGCAAGMTLAYDHCKNHPQHVDVGRLPDSTASRGPRATRESTRDCGDASTRPLGDSATSRHDVL